MDDRVTFEFDCNDDEMSVERDARIFEAGDYPDKGISVSEADLDSIVSNFTEAPVKVEHTDSPLDPLGVVKRVWRQGNELLARLAFPTDMASFLERRGVKKLSVALHKDPLRLAEVSLVLSPRVASAAMFGDSRQPEIQNPQFREGVNEDMSMDERDKEIAELRFALRTKDVDARLAELKSQGKLVPASETYAREILLQGDGKITFGEGETTVAQLFECFLETQPKVVAFGELAPGVRASGAQLSAEEEELLGKLGVTREQVEKYAG